MINKPHPVDIYVGTMLRRQRLYAGLSQTALAESVNITAASEVRECGERGVSWVFEGRKQFSYRSMKIDAVNVVA
jgi:transcriptional regulator with XRE-family HTH domain